MTLNKIKSSVGYINCGKGFLNNDSRGGANEK